MTQVAGVYNERDYLRQQQDIDRENLVEWCQMEFYPNK